MNEALAHKAALLWGIATEDVTLAAHRENVVYRAETPQGPRALRLHRPGYRSLAELRSELQWMAALEAGGMSVPRPIPSVNGVLVETVDGTHIDLLTWLPGRPLGGHGQMDRIDDRAGFCRRLGQVLAQLHDLSDAWTPPTDFTRPAWDVAGLVGPDPLWGRFWDNPMLTAGDRALLLATRDKCRSHLEAIRERQDYGLIHADALSENVLTDGQDVALIDFDDGGWGFRDFELATFLLRFQQAEDYTILRDAMLEGYARRAVDLDTLELFILLRALTYPGWIIPRMGEHYGPERCTRALATALPLAKAYLDRP